VVACLWLFRRRWKRMNVSCHDHLL
jgi:hypothetical protein